MDDLTEGMETQLAPAEAQAWSEEVLDYPRRHWPVKQIGWGFAAALLAVLVFVLAGRGQPAPQAAPVVAVQTPTPAPAPRKPGGPSWTTAASPALDRELDRVLGAAGWGPTLPGDVTPQVARMACDLTAQGEGSADIFRAWAAKRYNTGWSREADTFFLNTAIRIYCPQYS